MMSSSRCLDGSLPRLSYISKQSTAGIHKFSRFFAMMLFLSMWMALSPATASLAATHVTITINTNSAHPSYRIWFQKDGQYQPPLQNTSSCRETDGGKYTVDQNSVVHIHAYTGSRCDGTMKVETLTATQSRS